MSNDEIKYCSICHRSEKDTGKMMDLPNGMHLCPDCMQKMINAAGAIDYEEIWKELQEGRIPMMPDWTFFTGSTPEQSGNSSQNGNGSGENDRYKEVSSSDSDPDGLGANGSSGAVNDAGDKSSGQNGDSGSETGGSGADHSGGHLPAQSGAVSGAAGGNSAAAGHGSGANGSEGSGNNEGTGGTDKDGDKDKDKDKDSQNRRPTVSFLNLGDIFGGGYGPQQRVKKKKKTGPKPVFTAENIPAPHLLKAELDKYVVGQENAKKTISVAAYNHYKRIKAGTSEDGVEIEKSNILLIGPTGCGKTYLVKTLARLLDVPLAITDATNLTEAGYIGDDVESCISKLLSEADNDVDKAEKGIVFIDEIDKLAKKQNLNSRDVSGEAVQQGLLKLLEGAEVEVPVGANSKNGMVPMTTVDTSNILFICGGAFPALEGIIKERLKKQTSMGFSAELKDKYDNDPNVMSEVTNEDLRKFGMIPEFIGRLPIVCPMQSLDEDMMLRILTEPKNAIIKQYQKLLAMDGVKLEFEEGALRAIARQAMQKETGARALRSILDKYMMDIMYEIPKDKNIGTVTITEDYINGKGGPRIGIRSIEATPPAGAIEDKKSQS